MNNFGREEMEKGFSRMSDCIKRAIEEGGERKITTQDGEIVTLVIPSLIVAPEGEVLSQISEYAPFMPARRGEK